MTEEQFERAEKLLVHIGNCKSAIERYKDLERSDGDFVLICKSEAFPSPISVDLGDALDIIRQHRKLVENRLQELQKELIEL